MTEQRQARMHDLGIVGVVTHFAYEEIEAQGGRADAGGAPPLLSSVWLWDAAEKAWVVQRTTSSRPPTPTSQVEDALMVVV